MHWEQMKQIQVVSNSGLFSHLNMQLVTLFVVKTSMVIIVYEKHIASWSQTVIITWSVYTESCMFEWKRWFGYFFHLFNSQYSNFWLQEHGDSPIFTFCMSTVKLFKAHFSFRNENYDEYRMSLLDSGIIFKYILYPNTNLAFLIEMKLIKDFTECTLSALQFLFSQLESDRFFQWIPKLYIIEIQPLYTDVAQQMCDSLIEIVQCH